MSVGNGGGATHIATKTGLLSTLSNDLSDILIVAGGGGGGGLTNTDPGNGGGMDGGKPTYHGYPINSRSGTQADGFLFGKGESGSNTPGGGGGLYGGYAAKASNYGAGAGSGYIGNNVLQSEKRMYANGTEDTMQESTNTGTYTVRVGSKSTSPMEKKPKVGNGYAKITYLRKAKHLDNFFFKLNGDNGRDLVNYDPNITFTYSGEYISAVAVQGAWAEELGSYEILPTKYFFADGVMTYTGTDFPSIGWFYDTSIVNQRVFPQNCTVIIEADVYYGATVTHPDIKISFAEDPGYFWGSWYSFADSDWYTFEAETWYNIKIRLTLENGEVTKEEYLVDNTIVESSDMGAWAYRFICVDEDNPLVCGCISLNFRQPLQMKNFSIGWMV